MYDLLNHLVPIKDFDTGFTTCEHINYPNLDRAELADKALGVHKVFSKTTHSLVEPPTPAHSTADVPRFAWEAVYPEGSINPAGQIPGGFGFYLSGPPGFAKRLEIATEAVFSYRMLLQDGWSWQKGGKLPGICKSCGLVSSPTHRAHLDPFCAQSADPAVWRMAAPEGGRTSAASALIFGRCGG